MLCFCKLCCIVKLCVSFYAVVGNKLSTTTTTAAAPLPLLLQSMNVVTYICHLLFFDCLNVCHVHEVTDVRLYRVERLIVEHLIEFISKVLKPTTSNMGIISVVGHFL